MLNFTTVTVWGWRSYGQTIRWAPEDLWPQLPWNGATELNQYRFDYELLEGADSGASGVLDKSRTNGFVTPYVGVEVALPIGKRGVALPRCQIGVPPPAGDFDTR